MGPRTFIMLAIVLAALVLLGTGWWRYAFVVFAIRARRMTVERLGLLVSSSEDVERVNGILASFVGGFNAMITRPSTSAVQAFCDRLSSIYRPFAQEGLAMGYAPRHLFHYDPAQFENRVVKRRPEYRYLHYVGLGFWSGMRDHSPRRLARIVEGLDPLHRYLCYDGYGFKYAFFDYRANPQALAKLERLEGYARNAAFQGVGRGFWFLYVDRPDVLIEHANRFGEYAKDIAAGAGLAAVFVYPDRLESARTLAGEMPAEWHDHFHLGMCFGLKARSINDVDQFERDTAGLNASVREAVLASVRECDRVELQVRAEADQDGYRCWRGRVTAWMAEHVQYPLAGVRASAPINPARPAVPTSRR